MDPSVRGVSHHRRKTLLENWSVCATTPGEDHAPSFSDSRWAPIDRLAPAAAALRALGRWSLNGPARRFDAQDWWYRLTFDALERQSCERSILGFDGLATISRVWLNGQALLSSDNMFVEHECDISNVLKAKENELLIQFSSLDALLAVRRKRPRWRTPMIDHQQLRWFRTTLLGRTSGWSPPAAVVGPWKDIWLEQRAVVDLNAVQLQVGVDGVAGVIQCKLQASAIGSGEVQFVNLELERNAQITVHQLVRCGDTDLFSGELRIDDAALWWPHTHGTPALYAATLRMRTTELPEDIVADLGRIGFRAIKIDTANGNFSLSVNDVPVFCRGACWTPLDPVSLRSTAADSYAAVKQVRDAGMNMLRIAGTMVYEDDHFFDACDEHGILVWQDFMFANMDYPQDDPAFLSSVTVEVSQQLRRRHATASMAMLCGNSEVEQQAAMWGVEREAWRSTLFESTLPKICSEYAPGITYWPSSVHGGSFPHQADEGTTSYYGVGAYLRNLDDARRCNVKFATECLAFANIPSDATLERMPGGLATRAHHSGWKERSPRDLGAGWDFDDVRDHYLAATFKTDPMGLRYSDHNRYLTLGRMATGLVMAATFAEWRRPDSPCQGALVLFLRDLWAGAGWGLIDDAGTPKACYHYLKRALQPLTVLLTDEGGNGLFAHVVNESGKNQIVELEICAWREGDVLVAKGIKEYAMTAHSGQSLSALDLFDHFLDLTYAYRFGPMTCSAVIATLRGQAGNQLAQAFYFPGGLTTEREIDIGLSAEFVMTDDQTAQVLVRTKHLAQGVHFDTPGFQPDDEYFNLQPNGTLSVILRRTGTRELTGSVLAINSVKEARLMAASPDVFVNMEATSK